MLAACWCTIGLGTIGQPAPCAAQVSQPGDKVADEESDRPFLGRELDTKRSAKPLAKSAEAAEEALRFSEGQVLAEHRTVQDGLVDIDRIGWQDVGER